jgi:hypothetical protein
MDRLKYTGEKLFQRYKHRNEWHGINFTRYVEKIMQRPHQEQVEISKNMCGQYAFYYNLFGSIVTPFEHRIAGSLELGQMSPLPPYEELHPEFKVCFPSVIQPTTELIPGSWISRMRKQTKLNPSNQKGNRTSFHQ